jgi:phosphopantetheinyl transferase (holo-ACP synthase)
LVVVGVCEIIMKILGVGVDLVKNARIKQYLGQSYADLFLKKFLHASEFETLEKF